MIEVEGGWPRRRRLPPPSSGEFKGCLGLTLALVVILILILICCGL